MSVETKTDGDTTKTIYHTPEGNIWTSERTHVSRQLTDGRRIRLRGMIHDPADYDPVLFMIEDTEFHSDPEEYENTERDFGDDGLIRDSAVLSPPFYSTSRFYGTSTPEGMSNWVYHQVDYPDHFAKLVEALERRQERALPLALNSPAEFMACGSISGNWGPTVYEREAVPFYQEMLPKFRDKGKICSCHAHASNLLVYKDLLPQAGFQVIEAFTPPPVGNLPLKGAREAWGDNMVIWVNFPETIFWEGPEATSQYTIELLKSDPPGNRLVIGFTEMLLAGIIDDDTERIFKLGTEAIMDAIDRAGVYPIQ